jgi:hypothetical protein
MPGVGYIGGSVRQRSGRSQAAAIGEIFEITIW